MENGTSIIIDKGTVPQALAQIEAVAQHPIDIMRAISGYLVTATQRHIEREEGPDGKWRPLSPRTVTKRIGRRQRGSSNILRVTGGLYRSLIGDASENEAVVGSNYVSARIHQLGGVVNIPEREQDIYLGRSNRGPRFVKASAVRKKTKRVTIGAHSITIPARAYLYLSDDDSAAITDIAATKLAEQLL